jgi:PKD repeat protein
VEIDVRNRLPVAVAGDDVTIAEDQVLVLDGSSSEDSPSDVASLEYRWVIDGDDRGWSPNATAKVSWVTEGSHTADLYVRDDDGAVSSDRVRVSVINLAPVVADPGNITADEDEQVLIQTTATDTPSDQDELRYRILFGDGNLTGWIAEAKRTHVYRTAGIKQVRVDAKDEDGAIGSVSFNVTVRNVVPTCTISLLVTDLEEDEEFTAYGSVSDTYSDSETLRWRFDFGDGNSTDWRRKPVARVPHVYSDEGTYNVTMYVMDDDGDTNTSTMQVTVGNVVPSVTLVGPIKALDEDEPFYFSAEGTDTESDLPDLLYWWDFGDETFTGWTNVSLVLHRYDNPGTYTVTVTVSDDEGDQDITTVLVRVDNVEPTAEGTQNRTNVVEDEAVGFDASASTDTPSDLPYLQYEWSWGGQVRYGMQSTFVWSEAGSYTVVLTVIDDDGAIDEDFFQVTVTNVVPGGVAIVDRTDGKVGEAFTFNVVGLTDTPSDLTNLTVTWNFDDGTILVGRTVTHSFSQGGEHSVMAIIKDDDGAKVERVLLVSVDEEPSKMAGSSGLLIGVAIAVAIIVIVVIMVYRARGPGRHSAPDEEVGPSDQAGPVEDDEAPGEDDEEGSDEPAEDEADPSEQETQLYDEDQ